MSDENENKFEDKLKNVIEIIDAADAISEPLTDTVISLLETSSAILNSAEASVLIRDGNEGDLKFLCAIGKVADQLAGLKIPAGKGIAGFVFSSGQPLAISDVGVEESFYAEVDRQTGFSTQTILATPLIYDGIFIGVLEYVNRIGEPPFEPFSPEEMNTAAIYADAIAGIVNAFEASRLYKDLSKRMINNSNSTDYEEIKNWLDGLKETTHHKEMLELAVLVNKIAHSGEAERNLCKDILQSFSKYTDNNANSNYSLL